MGRSVTRYGAEPGEWDWAVATFGAADLLPVVSNPNATISPNSTLKTIGKTPSRYDAQRRVVGIANWTRHQSSEREVESWRREQDYGTCVQCRGGRNAIDVDVDETAKALGYARAILAGMGLDPDRQLCRWRANSGRILVPVHFGGDRRKQVIPVEGGNIEILGTGCQFVGAGCHPSGQRYQWSPMGSLGSDLA